MASIIAPELEITLEEGAPTSTIVPNGEPRRAWHAKVRVACDVEFPEDIPTNAGVHLGFELFGDDNGERRLLTPLVWGEVNPNGGLLLQRRVVFFSNQPAGTRSVERVGYVNHLVLDEDEPSALFTSHGTFDVRESDEIVAVFTLTRFVWPSHRFGFTESTAETTVTVRI